MIAAPAITGLAWGRIEIDGHPTFKDAKIWPGGARAWDWRETGTHHQPGILPPDVKELVERGATTVVLSRGVWRRLQVAPETLSWLANHNVDARILQTEEAVKCFNELREIVPLGGLFHTTC
ncbi:MAG: MTH938/NDUFAF3 family protein [Pseudomonadota bacterium]